MEIIEIVEVKKYSEEVIDSFQNLLPQLSVNYKSFDRSNLEAIVKSESTRLFVACDSTSLNKIVGTYTLVIIKIPMGTIIRIEDVVVGDERRGEGIGKKMMQHAIDIVKSIGVNKIELTSHPSRIEANKLYQSLGFTKIDTNVYRYKI